MPLPNLGTLRHVADQLDKLELNYAFIGGSVVNLLLDDPEFSPARPTDDVDVIIEVLTTERYSSVEARIRAVGFEHDMRQGAPLCRWVLGVVTVDIMPTDGEHLGLNTEWFAEVLATASVKEFESIRINLVSPVAFLTTKCIAFLDRGRGDFYASQDLEDFIAVIDGRAAIVDEVINSPIELRNFVVGAVTELLNASDFGESLTGHLPPDQTSQRRLPGLRKKLRDIAAVR